MDYTSLYAATGGAPGGLSVGGFGAPSSDFGDIQVTTIPACQLGAWVALVCPLARQFFDARFECNQTCCGNLRCAAMSACSALPACGALHAHPDAVADLDQSAHWNTL